MLVARAADSSKFRRKSKKKNSDFSYIVLYTLSTDHIQYYNMSYSEGDDSDDCESFSVSRLAMTKGLIRKAVTVSRRETPSWTEMGELRGLLCWTVHGVVFRAIGDQKYVLSRFRPRRLMLTMFVQTE